MAAKVFRWLWGDLTKEEYKKFGLLAVAFLFLIGTYWLMRPLKDALFMNIVGKTFIPRAKMLSVLFLLPLLLLYSKLVDLVEKHKLLYIIPMFYVCLFAVYGYFLAHPTIGVANTVPDKGRIFGWLIYLTIESFGSILPALFWSFMNSTTDAASAKRGYGIIISGAQIGSIAGPEFAKHASYFGMPLLAFIVAVGIFFVPVMIFTYMKSQSGNATVDPSTVGKAKKPATGFLEGLRLLFSHKYLMGVLGIATLYEVIGTIIDYQLKFLAAENYPSAEKVAEFLGLYGQCANLLALVFALVGTSYIIRTFGLRFSLVTFPICVGAVILYVWLYPSLWVFFGAMVIIKGLSYALNNPCKEIMYIPTSKDVKFKAKGWIDGFGGRSSKAVGSAINDFFPTMTSLMFYGSLISLGIVGVWIIIAMYVGTKNQQLVETNTIIE
ncbi:MAG: Plastidic atp adp transporter [candidate division TM6 bacterium GW2011_GWF2_38_10]|nr:MAG: Plastidic atp adp transporter [candidate division TM6 bacterium GW2011_GWF2_38_10]